MDENTIIEYKGENQQEQLFIPVMFIFLTGMWATLYFGLINFYSCSPKQFNISCFLLPAISWTTWLISSFAFTILCSIKVFKEKKPIDILIMLGYGWLYGITLIMLFE